MELLNSGEVNLGVLPNGETALHAACLFGHKNVVMALITAGAHPNLPNRVGLFGGLIKKGNTELPECLQSCVKFQAVYFTTGIMLEVM